MSAGTPRLCSLSAGTSGWFRWKSSELWLSLVVIMMFIVVLVLRFVYGGGDSIIVVAAKSCKNIPEHQVTRDHGNVYY